MKASRLLQKVRSTRLHRTQAYATEYEYAAVAGGVPREYLHVPQMTRAASNPIGAQHPFFVIHGQVPVGTCAGGLD